MRLGLAQPTVSEHLRMLPESRFVEAIVDAQRRLYLLRAEPLQEIDAWLGLSGRSGRCAHFGLSLAFPDWTKRIVQNCACK